MLLRHIELQFVTFAVCIFDRKLIGARSDFAEILRTCLSGLTVRTNGRRYREEEHLFAALGRCNVNVASSYIAVKKDRVRISKSGTSEKYGGTHCAACW